MLLRHYYWCERGFSLLWYARNYSPRLRHNAIVHILFHALCIIFCLYFVCILRVTVCECHIETKGYLLTYLLTYLHRMSASLCGRRQMRRWRYHWRWVITTTELLDYDALSPEIWFCPKRTVINFSRYVRAHSTCIAVRTKCRQNEL